MPHPLRLASRLNYTERLAEAVERLGTYRRGFVTEEQLENWLCNFHGFADQDCALSLVEDLLVLSEADIELACGALLEEIRQDVGDVRVFHLVAESSGAQLVRLLEKVHRVRGYEVLWGRDLFHLGRDGADAEELKGHLKKLTVPHVVAIWDTMLGTGGQMIGQRRVYEPIFAGAGLPFQGLRFAFITGHRTAGDGSVYLWRESPVCSDEQRDLNERYATACVDRRTHETGALVTLPDNPPNNVPVVLRSRTTASWDTLLDRRETVRP